jgi:hypothetical protein
MTCGAIAWWRAITDDLESLVDRHGVIEHFLVQQDFVVLQPTRIGIAEYSIPGASWRAKKSGNYGFADLVSFATSELWEIKPKSGGDKPAVDKATHYVTHAKAQCGTQWALGKSYATSSGDGVVFRYAAGGVSAELFAEQGQPGAILYHWKISGKPVPVLAIEYRMALYEIVVNAYFSSPVPQRLPGARPAPDDLPPGRWKPPLYGPESVSPAFVRLTGAVTRFLSALLKSVRTTYHTRILEGSAVAVALDLEVFNLIVGASVVQRQIGLLQVQSDQLFRQTATALSLALVSAPGLTVAAVAGGWALSEVISVAEIPVVVLDFVTVAAGTIRGVASGGALMESLLASLGRSAIARLAASIGASVVAFVIPSASSASPNTPVSVRVSVPLVQYLTPREAQRAKLGDRIKVNDKEAVIVALLVAGPD